MTNTPAGQDHPTPEEKGQSATVDALANAAGRGTPSADAMKAATAAWYGSITKEPTVHGQLFQLACAMNDYAARRVEQAVAQERERCLFWAKVAWSGEAIEAIEKGRPKP